MIRVNRDSVSAPADFIHRASLEHQKLAEDVRMAGHKQRTLKFNEALLRAGDLRKAVHKLFRGACAFCETPLFRGGPQVSHFRPRERAAQLDGAVSPLHYWWLAYQWRNLYATCGDCEKHKGKRFPVRGRRAEYDPQDPLRRTRGNG